VIGSFDGEHIISIHKHYKMADNTLHEPSLSSRKLQTKLHRSASTVDEQLQTRPASSVVGERVCVREHARVCACVYVCLFYS